MTPSLEDITENLKSLVENISSSQDNYKHDLMKETHELKRHVQLIKEVCYGFDFNFNLHSLLILQQNNFLDQMTNLSQAQPRASLIAALQDERSKAKMLETENAELRATIDSYQQSFKLIMNKYKTHDDQLKSLNKHEGNFQLPIDEINRVRYEFMQQQVNNMVLVIDKATTVDFQKLKEQETKITKLHEDNTTLKKILLCGKKPKLSSIQNKNLPSN